MKCRNVNIAEEVYSSLVDKGFLEADGVGRGTKYQLSSMFDFENSDDIQDGSTRIINDVKLNEDELKIVSYIKQNGSITNAMSREEFGLTKHKSTDLFNSLVLKEKIERVGGGNQTKYILKEK